MSDSEPTTRAGQWKGSLDTDPGLEEDPPRYGRWESGWGNRVLAEAEAIVIAFPSDLSQRSLVTRKQGILHACQESLLGPVVEKRVGGPRSPARSST